MRRIDELPPHKCTGCFACLNACPVNAIESHSDIYGFPIPFINDWCTNCGKCANVCPAMNDEKGFNKTSASFAAWGSESYRERGSSGGIFGSIAEIFLSNGGIVYGAAFSDGFRSVTHARIEDLSHLKSILKSKYVQSNINKMFRSVADDLSHDKRVLFSGTPCQVDALKFFLGKDYPNLYLIDIICHGVPSPLVFNSYLDEIAKGRSINAIDFRDKRDGWGLLINIEFSDGEHFYEPYNGGYFRSFLSGLSMRSACFNCSYATPHRTGDLTIADFWGIEKYKKELNDRKGTSLILCNSERGQVLLEMASANIEYKEEIPYADVIDICTKINGSLIRPMRKPEQRECFFKHLLKGDSFSHALRYAEKAIMDIGIVGWWVTAPYTNYGSGLTTFALYRFLSDMGYSVTFISPPGFDRKNAGSFNRENGYRMTMLYSPDQMINNNKYIDTFIVGSDVLWYYHAMINSGYTHLLDFVDDEHKKISYATSFGQIAHFFPEEVRPKVRSLMQRFDHISVREFEAVKACKDHFDIDATHVLDPVFLLDMKHWNTLASRASIKTKGEFLFAYMLDPTPEKADELRKLATLKGLKLVCITDRQFNPEEKREILKDYGVLPNASINDVVYHLKHASFIVTDSYHGYCFSLIFKRDYIVLVNRVRGGGRFDTIADLFNIRDRFAENVNEISTNLHFQKPINYGIIEHKLNKEIERSKHWLINAIEMPKKEKMSNTDSLLRDLSEYAISAAQNLTRLSQAVDRFASCR